MSHAALRESQAAVALIRVRHEADWKYLCQWSDSWQALHFVGGHREGDETFHACAVREVLEELPVAPGEVAVPAEPLSRLEYVAFSESARVPTFYVMAVFFVGLAADARPAVDARPENRWVTRAEVRAGRMDDGTRVSPTVELILTKLGL